MEHIRPSTVETLEEMRALIVLAGEVQDAITRAWKIARSVARRTRRDLLRAL